MQSRYGETKSAVVNAGNTIGSPSNLGAINASINCLDNYSNDLAEAATACENEVAKCQADLAAAEAMSCTPIEC